MQQSDRPAPPVPAPEEIRLLEALPTALLMLDTAGCVVWANGAAQALLGTAAERGHPLPPASDDPWPVPGGERHVRLRHAPRAEGGHWVQVEDVGELLAAREALQRQTELLDVAQDFGRLGVWYRDARTLAGRWDRHVFKFWGLGPDAGAPTFESATRQIVEEDRAALEAAFRASLRRAGSYAHRFRVRRPDGGLTHLHSLWQVKDGADGQPERVVGIMFDDSEALAQARARDAMQSQLDLAEAVAGLVVWRHDLATDRMHFNAAGWALIGREPDEAGIAAAEVRSLIHPDDLPRVLESAEAAMSLPGPVDIEARHAAGSGRWRRVLTRRVVQRDTDGRPTGVLGVALDLTERGEAEHRAHEMTSRFELVARTAGIGYWLREGTARAYWNAQMRAVHGLSETDPVPSLTGWIERFVHPEDVPEIRRRFGEWASSHVPKVEAALRVVRADGSVRHLLTHSMQERGGATPVYFGIVVDVTERHLADLALRQADQRAALAARGAGIGTWELDLESGAVVWDAQMWQLRGRPPHDRAATREEQLEMVHPDDRERAAERVGRMYAGDDLVEHEFRIVRPDGQVRWLASRSTQVLDAAGRAVRRIGVNWDVTADRLAEAERREREAAERASAEKTRFLARMSHELRTPLNAVLGFAQLMQADDDPAQRAPRLQHIHAAGRHLLALINDVLDLASLDSGEQRVEPRALALATLLQETLPLLEPLRAQQGIVLSVDAGGLQLLADPVRLRQVLINLLSNAFKYNRAGGRTTVHARRVGPWGEIEITDEGRGMSDAQQRQLFQPFNRLGIEGTGIEGTGIGLTIVKALVERMGGALTVRSAPGAGTRVTVRLPLADGGGTLDPARGLLYVEDNEVNAMIVAELMRRRPDVRLLHAPDAAAGLAMARERQPALVLLDMQLPDADGLTLMAQMHADARTADIRCIALSANALPEEIARARAAGVSDYWTKPLDAAAFVSAIDGLFGPPAG